MPTGQAKRGLRERGRPASTPRAPSQPPAQAALCTPPAVAPRDPPDGPTQGASGSPSPARAADTVTSVLNKKGEGSQAPCSFICLASNCHVALAVMPAYWPARALSPVEAGRCSG